MDEDRDAVVTSELEAAGTDVSPAAEVEDA